MPWRCPACETHIRHAEFEAAPHVGPRYRCPVCRLELVFDPRTDKLVVAPLDDREQKSRETT
jgi:rubredoxin